MPRKTNCTLRFEPITVDTISRIINDLKIPRDAGVRVASLPQLRQVVRGDYGAVFYGTTTLKHRFPL